MKEAVSSGLRRDELSKEVRDSMVADLSVDLPKLAERLRSQLAGRTIPWADERRGLKTLLLAETPLFHFQANDLKTVLKEGGILQRVQGKEVCVFAQSNPANAT